MIQLFPFIKNDTSVKKAEIKPYTKSPFRLIPQSLGDEVCFKGNPLKRTPFKLIRESGIPDAYNGEIMVSTREQEAFGISVAKQTGKGLQKLLSSTFKKQKIDTLEKKLANLFAAKAGLYPEKNLQEILKELALTEEKKLIEIQLKILEKATDAAQQGLKNKLKNTVLEHLINSKKNILEKGNKPFFDKQQNIYPLIKLSKIERNNTNQTNFVGLKTIIEILSDLPTVGNNKSAFIVEYQRHCSDKIAERLINPYTATTDHIDLFCKGGVSKKRNYLAVMNLENARRQDKPFDIYITENPEIPQHIVHQFSVIEQKIKSNELIGYENYLPSVSETIFNKSKGKIDLEYRKLLPDLEKAKPSLQKNNQETQSRLFKKTLSLVINRIPEECQDMPLQDLEKIQEAIQKNITIRKEELDSSFAKFHEGAATTNLSLLTKIVEHLETLPDPTLEKQSVSKSLAVSKPKPPASTPKKAVISNPILPSVTIDKKEMEFRSQHYRLIAKIHKLVRKKLPNTHQMIILRDLKTIQKAITDKTVVEKNTIISPFIGISENKNNTNFLILEQTAINLSDLNGKVTTSDELIAKFNEAVMKDKQSNSASNSSTLNSSVYDDGEKLKRKQFKLLSTARNLANNRLPDKDKVVLLQDLDKMKEAVHQNAVVTKEEISSPIINFPENEIDNHKLILEQTIEKLSKFPILKKEASLNETSKEIKPPPLEEETIFKQQLKTARLLVRNKLTGKDEKNVLQDLRTIKTAAQNNSNIPSKEILTSFVESYENKLEFLNQLIQKLSKLPNLTSEQIAAKKERKLSAPKITPPKLSENETNSSLQINSQEALDIIQENFYKKQLQLLSKREDISPHEKLKQAQIMSFEKASKEVNGLENEDFKTIILENLNKAKTAIFEEKQDVHSEKDKFSNFIKTLKKGATDKDVKVLNKVSTTLLQMPTSMTKFEIKKKKEDSILKLNIISEKVASILKEGVYKKNLGLLLNREDITSQEKLYLKQYVSFQTAKLQANSLKKGETKNSVMAILNKTRTAILERKQDAEIEKRNLLKSLENLLKKEKEANAAISQKEGGKTVSTNLQPLNELINTFSHLAVSEKEFIKTTTPFPQIKMIGPFDIAIAQITNKLKKSKVKETILGFLNTAKTYFETNPAAFNRDNFFNELQTTSKKETINKNSRNLRGILETLSNSLTDKESLVA